MAAPKIPSLSEKEYLIVNLLIGNGSKPMYGLELVERSDGALKRGTIYVTLGRLEDKGYVTSEKESEQPGIAMPRRHYKVTGEGRRVFQALSKLGGSDWLQEVLT